MCRDIAYVLDGVEHDVSVVVVYRAFKKIVLGRFFSIAADAEGIRNYMYFVEEVSS